VSDLTQFDRQSANRIARVVRAVEGEPQQAKPLSFDAVQPPRPFRIQVAKPQQSAMPESVAIFDIYTGAPGSETFSGITATAYVRSVSLVPGEYVSVSKIDGDKEVVGGGYQLRFGTVNLNSDWSVGSSRAVEFDGGGAATVVNNVGTIPASQGEKKIAASYSPNALGMAAWQLVSAQDAVFRVCTFSGSWPIGSTKTVTPKFSGSSISAINLFWPLNDSEPGSRDCCVGKDGTAWFLMVPQLFSVDFFTAATATQCGIKFDTLPGIALSSQPSDPFVMSVQTVPVVTAATVTSNGIRLDRVSVGVLCKTATDNVLVPFASPDLRVVTSVTVTNTAIVFTRKSLKHFGVEDASVVELPITTCATATSSQ
jgi:hypothetical protein